MPMENEDDDPVGAPPVSDPRRDFTRLAIEHGLIRAGDKLDQNMMGWAFAIVELCASIGDGYGSDETGGNASEHIRAAYADL